MSKKYPERDRTIVDRHSYSDGKRIISEYRPIVGEEASLFEGMADTATEGPVPFTIPGTEKRITPIEEIIPAEMADPTDFHFAVEQIQEILLALRRRSVAIRDAVCNAYDSFNVEEAKIQQEIDGKIRLADPNEIRDLGKGEE